MTNPELLKLIENCRQGTETLITRIVHIHTQTSNLKIEFHMFWYLLNQIKIILELPSYEIIQNMQELYRKNRFDVRFLIPVLAGLEKV